jgi:hypothetical protein
VKKPKVIKRTKADKNNEVVSVLHSNYRYRRTPCEECPWKKSSPRRAFPAEAFRISARTAYDMSESEFSCHMSGVGKPTTCAGFILSGSDHNLCSRKARVFGNLDMSQIHSEEPLYETYRHMAEANGVDPNDPVLAPCRPTKKDLENEL